MRIPAVDLLFFTITLRPYLFGHISTPWCFVLLNSKFNTKMFSSFRTLLLSLFSFFNFYTFYTVKPFLLNKFLQWKSMENSSNLYNFELVLLLHTLCYRNHSCIFKYVQLFQHFYFTITITTVTAKLVQVLLLLLKTTTNGLKCLGFFCSCVIVTNML